MSNQVKQLELGFGMLTVAQQETVDHFVSNSKRNADNASARTAKIEALLISGGFKAGIDYVNTLEIKTITEDRQFSYHDEFSAEVTYVSSYGGCQLMTEYYDSYKNIMSARLVLVGIEHDNKLECSTITSQYRAYKPTSLLTKLQEYNASQLYKFNAANKQKGILDYTVDKYKTLFPNAEVSVGSDYYKSRNNYTQFPIVYVNFENGSWVSFRIGYEIDKEYLHKKYDAQYETMNAEKLLELFNNQNQIQIECSAALDNEWYYESI
jgi:hypothetical protein